MHIRTPVVLIIFKRPDTTEKLLNVIRQVQPPKLLVIADGPRPEKRGEAEKCAATRAIVHQVDWNCEIITNYSDINLGCRERIATGITWAFNLVEEAIILEDDCVPHPTFFRFCEELLERYRHDNRIISISGNNFQFGRQRTEYSYYFSRYIHNWGWASWRRAWQHYDDRMSLWPEINQGNWLKDLLINETAVKYWTKIFNDNHNEFIKDSWAYRFVFAAWLQNGINILPNVNLVSNIGFRPDAVHTRDETHKSANIPVKEMEFPLKHPQFILSDREADEYTEKTIFSGYMLARREQASQINQKITQAVAQLNAENNLQALTLFQEAIAARPNLQALKYGQALALARLGRFQEAAATLKQLLAVMPKHQKAQVLHDELIPVLVRDLMTQANQALNANQTEAAFNLLIQAKSLKSPILGLDYLRAMCFLRLQKLDDAIQALHEELRHFPENEAAKNLQNQLRAKQPPIIGKIADPEFQELLQIVRPYTMLSEARLYSLFSLVRRICQENIPGNIVECGVAGGGSTALMAAVIKRYSKQPRWLYAFDSFEGMPQPTEHDRHNGIPAEATGWGTGTCAAPETSVREICSRLGVSQIVKTVKGYFQDTLPKMRDTVGTIALLHSDGDWYESTKTIFHNLYPRIVNDGFIQVDDYGHWEGARQAVTEFANQHQIQFQINPIDSTGVWWVKPDKFPLNPTLEPTLVAEFNQDDPAASSIESQMSANERFQLYYTLRQLLPPSNPPLRFIEIGSYAGASLFLTTKALKRTTPQLQGFAVEPGGRPQFYQVLQHFQPEIAHLRMFSHEAAAKLHHLFSQDRKLATFIFIDGDHTYPGVKQDIIDYFPLLAPGGIMMFHDYLPPLDDENRSAILFHHGGKEPGIRQACEELMEQTYRCEILDLPLLYPTDPTQTQAHLPIIPGVFSTIKAYRKPLK
ncbi:MAG TPA: class I SAM-dependent methyltransferase [Oscillatoriaceae cyanobacterium M33_DOE_052]|uniref:Tetratricopeptide repeat protein n=1 Tax=Planktothricoides sp. SpSt-374 TaxID=2282167 RepID=A0A7C3ZMM6_9CYAN|nr:class I SAM-dependent methyltransferase [Oscillatoriaceae cyanobacterium M33_DOE_052]